MDVNQVRFGNYSIGGNAQGRAAKRSEQSASEAQTQAQSSDAKKSNADDVLKAMNFAGMQNMAQISFNEAREVNPADYLDEKRISDIEAMMAEFELGVEQTANTIEAEFPGVFSDASRLALAANIFAAE